MSYQVLARKWRPKRFAELVGQEHVKSTLINALKMGRLHHAYLFTGTRGVGKTTIARIFAKSLNCEQGVSAEPCGQCDTCVAIEQGHFVDLIEIDAASRTKVEDTREILDNVQYAPTRGRYKVYLIDEVHMLSRHSFNALLKTLEEPPEHVKFLLATTDPQKLPITILSRCLQFNLKALLRSEIKAHLADILTQEQIPFDDEALTLLAKAADGSLRDGLSLTDQAIAQSAGELRLQTVEKMLGTIDKQWSVKLLAHIVNHDGASAMATVEDIARLMPDYRGLTDELLSIFHLAAMAQLVPGAAQIDESLHQFITRLAQKLSAQDVQLYYQILLSGKKDLEHAPDLRMGFEMLLLRLLAFTPVAQVAKPSSAEPLPEVVAQAPLEVPNIRQEQPQSKPLETTSEQEAAAQATSQTQQALASTPLPEQSSLAQEAPLTVESTSNDADETGLLDEETINAQQQSVYESALSQGYNPVESVADELPLTASVQPNAAEPDPVAAPESTHEAEVAGQQHQQLASGAPTSSEPETQQVEVPAQPEFEDPVAAILANRNLSLDSMFNPNQASPEQPAQANAPDGEGSAKKPEALGQSEPVSPVTAAAASHTAVDVAKEPVISEAEGAEIAQPDFEPQVQAKPDSQDDFGELPVAFYDDEQDRTETPPLNESDDFAVPPADFWQHSAPEGLAPQQDEQQAPVQYHQDTKGNGTEQPLPPQTQVLDAAPKAAQTTVAAPTGESLIDKELPRWAHQVDEWASLIEQMGLGGLVRLLAVQSVYSKQDKTVTLNVYHSEKHLDSKGLRDQLQRGLSLVLKQPIELELNFTEEQLNTPLNIQRQIDADRLARAKQLIYQDPLIVALQQQFGAEVNDDSIVPVG